MGEKFFDSNGFKLFVTFFLIYVLFIHWGGWNEESRLALSETIAYEGHLQIDSFANFTGDRAYYGGHYYSEKAPGSSLLAAPILSIVPGGNMAGSGAIQNTSQILIQTEAFRTEISHYYDLSADQSILRILILSLLSALPGALLVVLIYRTCKLFVDGEKYSLFCAFVFGLGTLIFPYSEVFMGNILAAFVSFLGFYLLLKALHMGESNGHDVKIMPGDLLLPSILLGFAIVLDYFAIFVLIGGFALLLFDRRDMKELGMFAGAALIGILPLILYNASIFPSPFELTIFHVDPTVSVCNFNPKLCPSFTFHNLLDPSGFDFNLWGILLSQYRGLFFYCPVLIFSILGFYHLFSVKGRRNILALSLLIIIVGVVASSTIYDYWFGGSSFSFRYGVIAVPFLSLPFATFVKKYWGNRLLMLSIILLFSVSAFNSLLSTGASWEGPKFSYPASDINPSTIYVTQDWSTGTFSVRYSDMLGLNPLVGHYLPMFLRDGPRSRIFEGIVTGSLPNVDVREFQPIYSRDVRISGFWDFGTLVVAIPFLVLVPIIFASALIWRKELSVKVGFMKRKTNLANLLLAFGALLLLSFFRVQPTVLGTGWYPVMVNLTSNSTDVWMGANATVFFHSGNAGSYDIILSTGTAFRPKTMEVAISGKTYDRLVSSFNDSVIMTNVTLSQGENELGISSLSGCDRPALLTNGSKDYRCLGFKFGGIRAVPALLSDEISFETGWYHSNGTTDAHWSSGDSELTVFSDAGGRYKLNLTLSSYHDAKELEISADGAKVDMERAELSPQILLTRSFDLRRGFNDVRMTTGSPCTRPIDLGNGSGDARCLGFTISNVTLVPESRLIAGRNRIIFGSNWYGIEETGRWMSDNSTIFYYSDRPGAGAIDLHLRSYLHDRTVSVYLNGKLVKNQAVPINYVSVDLQDVAISKGENVIELRSDTPCQIPSKIGGGHDDRCLSFEMLGIDLG